MRSLRDPDLGAIRRQHPDRNFQTPPHWVNDRDRSISPLRSAEDLKDSAMEWVERVENPDVRAFCTQGIVGVGASIPTFTASFRPEGRRRTTATGCAHGILSFCR
jgi:hypothetical protein